MRRLDRLINLNTYRWLAKCAYPYWKSLVLIISINLFQSVSSVAIAVVSRQMIDLAVQQDLSNAKWYAIAFSVLVLARIGLSGLVSMVSARVSEFMSNNIQRETLKRLYNIEWRALNKYHSGDIMTRLTSDTSNIVNGWVNLLPNVFALAIQLVIAFLTLMYFDRALAVLAFILGPISAVIGWIYGRKLKKMQHFIQEAESRCRSFLHEAVQHLLIVKTFEYDKESIEILSAHQNDKLNWVVKRSNLGVITNIVLSGGYWVGYLLAFGWGVFRLSTNSTSFGTFTAFLQLVGQIQGPFHELSRTLPQMMSTIASAERVNELENLELEEKNSVTPWNKDKPAGIFMEQVSFSYEKGKRIVSNATMTVKPGETTALIGSSGEGKTTIIRMLLSLLKPETGRIYITGKNNQRRINSVEARSLFSYIPQGNTMFSGTIAANLRVGNPEATDEELETAARVSCAWDFIKSLPSGFDTFIGERGLGLSEGQAQRLCIARAILKPAPILLMDESTSALDIDTEQTILNNIKKLCPAKTCIVITHRLSVLEYCDSVYRLKDHTLQRQHVNSWDEGSFADAK